MSVLKQTEKIRSIVVSVLCRKNRRFQSEPVFVMERCREKENNLTRVLLTEIFTNGLCLVTYPCYNEEQQSLSDICLDSLLRLLYLVEPEFDFVSFHIWMCLCCLFLCSSYWIPLLLAAVSCCPLS